MQPKDVWKQRTDREFHLTYWTLELRLIGWVLAGKKKGSIHVEQMLLKIWERREKRGKVQ